MNAKPHCSLGEIGKGNGSTAACSIICYFYENNATVDGVFLRMFQKFR